MSDKPGPRGGSQRDRTRDASLWEEAKAIIPGGSQLVSKRVEMFAPDQWPAYYQSANGVAVTDMEGNEYVDMSLMGVGACILGYADEDVDAAACEAICSGSMSTLNPPEELELADLLLELHPWADMVRFGRPGGEAMAMAVRLARAYMDRSTVAFCGYHGWHDWYLAANLETNTNLEGHLLPGLDPVGVPTELEGTAVPFKYNDIDRLEEIVDAEDLGAIVLEPIRHEKHEPGFLDSVRTIADEEDVPLVFDEITTGFRQRLGGIHEEYGVTPDIAVYGKAIANGYPMAAVVGRSPIMDMAQESFISSTFWTERIGPSAAIATLRKLKRENVPRHLCRIGERMTEGWERLAAAHGLDIDTKGINPLPTFEFQNDQSNAAMTLFTQEMLGHGYLAGGSVYVSNSHTNEHVDRYLSAVDDVFALVADAVERNALVAELDGPIAHTKFERLN